MRVGLAAIRGLVILKAKTLALSDFLTTLMRPNGGRLLRYIILPVYGIIYGLRRRLSNFYRPAKNRLMFLLANRYVVHVVVLTIAAVAGVINFDLDEVRAESDDFGQRSILYSLVTNQ